MATSSTAVSSSEASSDVSASDVIDPMRVQYHELCQRVSVVEECLANVGDKMDVVLDRLELLTTLRCINLEKLRNELSSRMG